MNRKTTLRCLSLNAQVTWHRQVEAQLNKQQATLLTNIPKHASRPLCKVHGAAAVVVQVATPVRPSPLAKDGLKRYI
jgi:hypothetical protein